MLNEKKVIIQYDKPTIVLDELSKADLASAGDPKIVKAASDKQETSTGSFAPVIHINSYSLPMIDYMKMDMSKEIPELLLTFSTNDTKFLYTAYPKDGDLLCLFLRSNSELYKPIRHDYSIVEVTGPGPKKPSDMPQNYKATSTSYSFIIKAQLRIPRLFQHACKSYPNMTSWQALRAVAKELNLGFSSNETNTNDAMTWISPNLSILRFIDTVVEGAWKSDLDSFEWWIDPYYNLTFVNTNKQLFGQDSIKEENIDKALANIGANNDVMGGLNSGMKVQEVETPILLTNDPHYAKYPFFINSYKVENNSGYVTNKYGYKTYVQFYDTNLVSDQPKNKYSKYPIESRTPQKLGPNSIILRGRPNEKVYQDEYKKEWVGTRYFDNTHSNIHQAPVQNLLNKMENYKIFLEVEMKSFVPWIYRGQYIPLRIVHTSPQDVKGQVGPTTNLDINTPGATVLDSFLSGKYIILGTFIEYRSGSLKTILRLGKKDWNVNDGVASNPEPITSQNG